jgi:hypothetical protein
MVYSSGINEGDHRKLFKQSWDALRKMGFADTAVPVIKSKPVDPDQTDDPSKMSWKRYVAWREQQEERKHGKKTGFVHPKPRHGNG